MLLDYTNQSLYPADRVPSNQIMSRYVVLLDHECDLFQVCASHLMLHQVTTVPSCLYCAAASSEQHVLLLFHCDVRGTGVSRQAFAQGRLTNSKAASLHLQLAND